MSVLEAVGAGLPIILRDIPEYQDTFAAGALLAKDDPGFLELIQKLQDDSAYYHAAAAGTAQLARRFDNHTGAEQLVKLYRELLGDEK